MLNAEIDKYMNKILECSENTKEKYGENGPTYIKKILYAIYANHTYLQAVYENQIVDALKGNDFAALKSVFYHAAKVKLLPCSSSGCDHCDRLWPLLDLLSCTEIDNIYRILPKELPLSTNGYAMNVNGINILLCLLYNNEDNAPYAKDKVTAKAEKYAKSKQPMWERSVISCLLAIMEHDVSGLSKNLQNVCESYNKMNIAAYMKIQCQNAYGLLILAKYIFSEQEFNSITLPEYKNFSKDYIEWFFHQNKLSDELCIKYEAPLEKVNDILKKPVAITRIYQPYINSDNAYLTSSEKKAWYMDTDTMMDEFLDIIE